MGSIDVFIIFAAALAIPSFSSVGGPWGIGQTFCLLLHKPIDLRHGTVESDNMELLMIGNIQDQVLTHNGQTDKAEITTRRDARRSADVDAGQTGATVSPEFSSTWFSITRECHGLYVSECTVPERNCSGGAYVGLKRGRPDEGLGENRSTYTAFGVILAV